MYHSFRRLTTGTGNFTWHLGTRLREFRGSPVTLQRVGRVDWILKQLICKTNGQCSSGPAAGPVRSPISVWPTVGVFLFPRLAAVLTRIT